MYKVITTFIITITILMFSLTLIFGEKQEFSSNENRYLTTEISFSLDRLLDGTFIKTVEEYLTDQFPLRTNFLKLNTTVKRLLGFNNINNVYISKDEYLIEAYNGTDNKENIVDVLNTFASSINYVNLDLMLVPTSVEINKNKLPKNAINKSQIDDLNYIYDKININTVNVYNTLMKNNKKYQMFYRLDHHWTTYGAYYAYYEYAIKNDLNPSHLSNYEIKEVTDEFNGTLYSKSNYYNYKEDKIHTFKLNDYDYTVNYVVSNKVTNSLYSDKYLSTKDKYSYFLDNNHPLIVVTNNLIDTDKEIVVIKDSYANCFVPFLTNHFKKVHVIDPRFYKNSISNYIKENNNIKDGLILYNMQTVNNDTGILSIK